MANEDFTPSPETPLDRCLALFCDFADVDFGEVLTCGPLAHERIVLFQSRITSRAYCLPLNAVLEGGSAMLQTVAARGDLDYLLWLDSCEGFDHAH